MPDRQQTFARCCNRDTDGDGNCPQHPHGIVRFQLVRSDQRGTYAIDLTADELSATICAHQAADRQRQARPPWPTHGRSAWNKAVAIEGGPKWIERIGGGRVD